MAESPHLPRTPYVLILPSGFILNLDQLISVQPGAVVDRAYLSARGFPTETPFKANYASAIVTFEGNVRHTLKGDDADALIAHLTAITIPLQTQP